MVTIQKYIRAKSLEEAYTLNQNKRNRIMGGMLWLKTSSGSVGTMIDLSGLGLDTIEEDDQQFTIGAMVTLRQLERHAGLNAYTNHAISDSVKDIIGVQFRNSATVGGSFWGRFGFSDVLTIFLALDSYVELYKGGIIPMEQFAAMKWDNDLLVRVIVKKQPLKVVYKTMRIQRTDFPVITCAVAQVNGEYREAIGARPGRAMLIRDERHILTEGITKDSIVAFADYAAEITPTGSNIRGSGAYRTHLIRVLTQRCLTELEG